MEKFRNIKNGVVVTVYADKNNGMYYAKSDDMTYFTRHYDRWEDLCDTLRIDGFCIYNEKEIAHVIERYNNPKYSI